MCGVSESTAPSSGVMNDLMSAGRHTLWTVRYSVFMVTLATRDRHYIC